MKGFAKYFLIPFAVIFFGGLGLFYMFWDGGTQSTGVEYDRSKITFEQFLQYNSINALGKNVNYSGDKFVGTTELKDHKGSIGIALRADTPSDSNDLSMGLLMMHDDILKYLTAAMQDEEFCNQEYFGVAFMTESTDKYGNATSKYILTSKYKLSELKKVKWDKISQEDIVDLADEYWTIDAFNGVTY